MHVPSLIVHHRTAYRAPHDVSWRVVVSEGVNNMTKKESLCIRCGRRPGDSDGARPRAAKASSHQSLPVRNTGDQRGSS